MTQAEIENVTNEILRALAGATEDRKVAALKSLKGETDAAASPVVGPLLMGMGAGAKFLGVSRSTLWRVLQAGKIEKVELFSGSYRVRRADLEALAAGKYGMGVNRSRRGRPSKEVAKTQN